MIKVNELWSLFKDVDGGLNATEDQYWQAGQTEDISWRNTAPTTPDPQLVQFLTEDVKLLQSVIAELKRGWGLD